ncbi:hypothetical protein Fifi067_00019 [Erwinia phage Fifi067]|nr:hypothetical protein Fifi067_00019 [Erwinia phage Fifi067]WBQ32528.1 hypothetical protein [Erwinia phage Kuerle]
MSDMGLYNSGVVPNYGYNNPNLNIMGNNGVSAAGGNGFSFSNNPNSALNYQPGQQATALNNTNIAGADQTGSFGDTLGMNIPTFQLGLSGLSTVGNLYGAFQANKLANSQFDYTKKITDTNLANSIKSYNTTLSDRAAARGSVEGWSDAQTSDYVNKNKL